MKTNDLSEFSHSYYEEANIYKTFSDAEDKEFLIWNELKDVFKNKTVLDLGCGNGRYLEHITTVTENAIGIDQSFEQLKQSNKKLPFIVADGSKLPFQNECFDFIISCWVWGTILDIDKRLKVLSEAKRVLKPNGKIFLIENDTPSEFEYYRGRHLNTKTQDYNDWLIEHGFTAFSKLETFITFDNVETAQYIFSSIWKDRLFDLPQKERIQNNVVIFELQNK